MGADYSCYVKNTETQARTFLPLNISAIGTVLSMYLGRQLQNFNFSHYKICSFDKVWPNILIFCDVITCDQFYKTWICIIFFICFRGHSITTWTKFWPILTSSSRIWIFYILSTIYHMTPVDFLPTPFPLAFLSTWMPPHVTMYLGNVYWSFFLFLYFLK